MKLDVKHIAKLANLPITLEEEKKFQVQLAEVLDHIQDLEKLDTSGVEPTAQITDLENVMREDEIKGSLSQEEATSQASRVNNGLFEVKGVFEEES